MRCVIVLSVAIAAVLAYGRQSSGYETAELYQPAPAVPLSANGGNQQAYNSDGALVVVSSPPPNPSLLPSSVAPITGTLVTTGPALVPVAGAIPVNTNGGLNGATLGAIATGANGGINGVVPGAIAVGTGGGLSSVNVPVATNGGLSGVNSGVVSVATNSGLNGVNIPVATSGVLNGVNTPVATNGGLNRAAPKGTVGNGYRLRRRLFRHRVRRVRL